MSDWQLLQEYSRAGSEAAFRTLVEQHIHLVFSAALRQTNDRGLAEDVTQAVFALLARKAASLSSSTILTGWLYRTTRHVAQTALRSEFRRRRREQTAVQLNDSTRSHDPWEAVAPLLDAALAGLSETDRSAILLRFFQDRSLQAVGVALGVSEEAAKKRVARAVERLRRFFAQHGCVLSTAALAALISSRAVQSAPASLVARVSGTAGLDRGAFAPPISLLLEEVGRRALAAKAQLAAAVLGIAAAIILLSTAAWRVWTPRDPAARAGPGPTHAPALGQAILVAAPSVLSTNPPVLPILVVDQNTGQGLAGAPLHIIYRGDDAANLEVVTDRRGLCEVRLPGAPFRSMAATIEAPGYVPQGVTWFRYEWEHLPKVEPYLARLERGRTLGGLVLASAGEPVARARLTFCAPDLDLSVRNHIAPSTVDTDQSGHWRSDQIPGGVNQLLIIIKHPDFVGIRTNLPLENLVTEPVFVLSPGSSLAGTVVSQNGQPVAQANVFAEADSSPPQDLEITTEPDGSFYFPHALPGRVHLKAQAAGFLTGSMDLECGASNRDVQFVLAGAPPAPASQRTTGSLKDSTVTLAGSVEDEETGAPIDRFRMLLGMTGFAEPGRPLMVHELESPAQFLGESFGGRFHWEWPPPVPGLVHFRLEVRAAGYGPVLSPILSPQETNASLRFRMKRLDQVSAQVFTPNGLPAAGALVQLAGNQLMPTLQYRPGAPLGIVIYPPASAGPSLVADGQGRFSAKPVAGADRVIVLHESGCTIARFEPLGSARIILQPWARIEGELRIGTALASQEGVDLQRAPIFPGTLTIPFQARVKTDAQGRFVFDRVPPGKYRVFRVRRLRERNPNAFVLTQNTGVEARPGETASIIVGGSGRKLVGQIQTVPADRVMKFPSDFQTLVGQRPESLGIKPEDITDPKERERSLWCFLFHYYLDVSADGRFEVVDVPPGAYELQLRLTETVPGDPGGPVPEIRRDIGSWTREVVVSEPAPGQENDPVDLGVISVEVKR